LWLELAELEEVEAKRLDLSQHAAQRGPVQEPGEHRVCAVSLKYQDADRIVQRIDPPGRPAVLPRMGRWGDRCAGL